MSEEMNEFWWVKWAIGGGVTLLLLIVLGLPFVIVGAGDKAVVYNMFSGQINRTVDQGMGIINPLTDRVKKYSLKTQRTDFLKVNGLSKDSQTIDLNIVINWRLDGTKLPDIYQKISGNIEDTIMSQCVVDTAKQALGHYDVNDIARSRDKLRNEMQSDLRERLGAWYIIVENVNIANIDYSDEYEKSIEQKLIAEQKALEAKNIKEETRFRSEAKKIENENLATSITPYVLRQKWIDKWDGRLPQYMLGSNTSALLNMESGK